MGNAYKDGKLEFFPHYVNVKNDYKIKLIRSEFGNDGMTVFWDVLEKLHDDKGYYMDWNEDICCLMAGELNFKQEYVEQIVNRLVSRSLFSDKLFNSVRVLTSKRTQNNYVRACSERKKIRIRKELRLFDDEDLIKLPDKVLKKLVFFDNNHEEKAIDLVVNLINPGVNPHSTEEESKAENSTGEDNDSIRSPDQPPASPPPVETVENSGGEPLPEFTYNNGKDKYIFTRKILDELKNIYPKVNGREQALKICEKVHKKEATFYHENQILKYIKSWFEKEQK